jgi:hypothetical protein
MPSFLRTRWRLVPAGRQVRADRSGRPRSGAGYKLAEPSCGLLCRHGCAALPYDRRGPCSSHAAPAADRGAGAVPGGMASRFLRSLEREGFCDPLQGLSRRGGTAEEQRSKNEGTGTVDREADRPCPGLLNSCPFVRTSRRDCSATSPPKPQTRGASAYSAIRKRLFRARRPWATDTEARARSLRRAGQ